MKFGDFIFYSVIWVQITAAIFTFQYWPITYYPMFSKPIMTPPMIHRFSVDSVFSDHTESWTKEDYYSFGLKNPRLQYYIHHPFHPQVTQILAQTIRYFHAQNKPMPLALRLNKITVQLQPDGNLIQTKEMVREVTYDQLSK